MHVDWDIRSAVGFLAGILRDSDARNVALRFWDGSTWRLRSDGEPAATLVFRHEQSLSRALRFPLGLAMAEAYIYDDLDVEGAFDAVIPLAEHVTGRRWTVRDWIRWGAASWRQRGLERVPEETRTLSLSGRRHGKPRDKQAVRHHYDLPIEFYRLWLDDRLMYSSAFYSKWDDDLDQAQARKLDYVCRGLHLKPGDRLLDLGCGWGGLAMYAAQKYGAIVHGITLSRRQAEIANERLSALGLAHRCRIEVRDYRDVWGERLYDKVTCIGMLQHVGQAHLAGLFSRIEQLLVPGGSAWMEALVSRDGRMRLGPFAERYVFPDAEVPPLDIVIRAVEGSGMDIRKIGGFSGQYARTVDDWRMRLERRHEQAARLVGEVTYRVWRLSLAKAAYLFRAGRLGVYQTRCVKASKRSQLRPLRRNTGNTWSETATPVDADAA
jgi:cyclopropane-fatty-acyl-phospholipid synthase